MHYQEHLPDTSLRKYASIGWPFAIVLLTLTALVVTGGVLSVWRQPLASRQRHLDNALDIAVWNGNVALTRSLLKQGANPNGHFEITVTQYRQPFLLNLQDRVFGGKKYNETTTPVLYTALNRATEPAGPASESAVIQALVEAGANVNDAVEAGMTPIYYAVRTRQYAIVKTFLDHGARINMNVEGLGTVVSYASIFVDARTMELLLQHGGSANEPDQHVYTPLMLASISNNTAVVKVLLRHHARLDVRNRDGATALDLAKHEKAASIIKLLREAMLAENKLQKRQ